MTSWYQLCDPKPKHHVYLVPADHGEYDRTGQYHLCNHKYHVYLVLADHGGHGRTGQYQLCDHIHYVYLVPGNMIGLASAICATPPIMYIWYWPIMGNTV